MTKFEEANRKGIMANDENGLQKFLQFETQNESPWYPNPVFVFYQQRQD